MRYVIRCGTALFALLLISGHIDYAQLWWRSRLSGRMEVQLVGCEDIQYAIDHAIPFEVIIFPKKECAISEPIIIGNIAQHLTLTGGMFVATPALGERSMFEMEHRGE